MSKKMISRCNSAIERAEHLMQSFVQGVAERGYASTFEWQGDDLAKYGAQAEVAKAALAALAKGLTAEQVIEYFRMKSSETLRVFSTSPCSNLMAVYMRNAELDFISDAKYDQE